MPDAADILKILSEICRVPVAELTPEKHLIRDLDLDSVLALELLMTSEERLGVEISEVDAAGLVTVADVLELIKQRSP